MPRLPSPERSSPSMVDGQRRKVQENDTNRQCFPVEEALERSRLIASMLRSHQRLSVLSPVTLVFQAVVNRLCFYPLSGSLLQTINVKTRIALACGGEYITRDGFPVCCGLFHPTYTRSIRGNPDKPSLIDCGTDCPCRSFHPLAHDSDNTGKTASAFHALRRSWRPPDDLRFNGPSVLSVVNPCFSAAIFAGSHE